MPANITPTLLGQQNSTGSAEALFLTAYSGKILTVFETEVKSEGLIDVQVVSGGAKSFVFPISGRAEAKYHQRGDNILDPANGYLNVIEQSEKEIFLDRPLVSARTTDDWDSLLTHWDAAARLATEQGKALAYKRDKQIHQLIHIASQTAPSLLNQPSGTNVSAGGTVNVGGAGWSFATKVAAEASMQAIGSAATRLAERNVPMDEIFIAMTPADYFAALTAPESPFIRWEVAGRDNGTIADNMAISRVAGFKIYWTNHLPQTSVGEDAGTFNTYGDTTTSADFTTVKALAFHKSCVGSVRRQGLTVERSRENQILGDLINAYFIEGHGVLRAEAAVTIAD